MTWRERCQTRLRVTAVGLLRASYFDLDQVLPAFVAAVQEDPELLWVLAADYLERIDGERA